MGPRGSEPKLPVGSCGLQRERGLIGLGRAKPAAASHRTDRSVRSAAVAGSVKPPFVLHGGFA